MKTSSDAWIEPRVEAETTNIFDMAALWPPAEGAATLPPAGEASEEGDASNRTTNSKNPKEKKTITRKGPEEPSEEAETK